MNQETQISLIVATARNSVIGNANALPWRMPSDLAHFKALTMGKAMIMGRKTWESIGKPLPGRVSIIVTSSALFKTEATSDDVPSIALNHKVFVKNLNEALVAAQTHPLVENTSEIMIIGGAQIYSTALPFASRIYRTLIDADVEGDAYFPRFKEEFHIISQSAWQQGEKDHFPFRTEIWERA